jgi:hypothetical protein
MPMNPIESIKNFLYSDLKISPIHSLCISITWLVYSVKIRNSEWITCMIQTSACGDKIIDKKEWYLYKNPKMDRTDHLSQLVMLYSLLVEQRQLI